jgi:hypothetical protein
LILAEPAKGITHVSSLAALPQLSFRPCGEPITDFGAAATAALGLADRVHVPGEIWETV